jgi:hypothetical protein
MGVENANHAFGAWKGQDKVRAERAERAQSRENDERSLDFVMMEPNDDLLIQW